MHPIAWTMHFHMLHQFSLLTFNFKFRLTRVLARNMCDLRISLLTLCAGTNQAVNFTAYTEFKQILQSYQTDSNAQLPSYQTTLIGLISGAMGPLSNAPIDTIKTRLQKSPAMPGVSAWKRITVIAAEMFKQEGFHAFYKGITPRVMRVAPGQAVTFTVYEYLKEKLENRASVAELLGGKYEE